MEIDYKTKYMELLSVMVDTFKQISECADELEEDKSIVGHEREIKKRVISSSIFLVSTLLVDNIMDMEYDPIIGLKSGVSKQDFELQRLQLHKSLKQILDSIPQE